MFEEESGLQHLHLERFLGSYKYDMLPYRDEIQIRHVFHLTVSHALPKWQHYERKSNSRSEPVSFEFEWIDLTETDIELAGGHGQMLPALRASMAITSSSHSILISQS